MSRAVPLEALDELTSSLASVVGSLDTERLRGRQAMTVVDRFAELERLATAGKLLAARRVADTGAWKSSGKRTAAAWMADRSGSGVGSAADGLATVERLEDCPRTRRAFRAGRVSVAQASEISRAVEEHPDAEEQLLAVAEREDLTTLRQASLKVRHSGENAEGKHRRQHAHRRASTFTDDEGMAAVDGRFTPEIGALVWSALDHYTDIEFRKAKAEGRHEDLAAYRADAMAAIFTDALNRAGLAAPEATSDSKGTDETPRAGGGTYTKTKVIVCVDHTALARGYPIDGETCEIAGVGPIPISVVEKMIQGDAFLAAIVTKGHDVVSVAHLGRQRTAYQRTALEWLYPTCTTQGCSNPRIQIDHRDDYARTHHTKVNECDGLCAFHHSLKTFEGWALVEGTGRRPMVPPDDPRHPGGHDPDSIRKARHKAGKPPARPARC